MAEKIDFKRDLDSYRASRGKFRQLTVPPMRYLRLDGHGDPNTSPLFQASLETLYPVSYRLKFASKQAGRDYVVPPLEGLWWAEDPGVFAQTDDRSQWQWSLLHLVPEWISEDEAIAAAGATDGPRRTELRVDELNEGSCVQILHVGPFSAEGEVLRRLHQEYLPAHGLRPTGIHHEIYLSDFRRTAPERLRTVLRQPVEA
ncbi:GyrI-like domain-containing protein [Actinomyces sp. F1_1611]